MCVCMCEREREREHVRVNEECKGLFVMQMHGDKNTFICSHSESSHAAVITILKKYVCLSAKRNKNVHHSADCT